jgi:hypothetical protein
VADALHIHNDHSLPFNPTISVGNVPFDISKQLEIRAELRKPKTAVDRSIITAMGDLLKLIWYAVAGLFRSRAAMQTEVLALRHQLNVLRRTAPKRVAVRPLRGSCTRHPHRAL